MFIKKKTEYEIKKEFNTFDLNEIKEGVNNFDKFIIFKKKKIINIYDRKCDHAGGRILSRNRDHVCPYHNWKFFPETGRYNNGFKKKKLPFKIDDKKIVLKSEKFIPHLKKSKSKKSVFIEYVNHAFLIIKGENFKFATDPWAFGPAFGLGWWLKNKTKKNWLEELNDCDFIYISHNHPDHLHQLSLSQINKNIQIIIPNFLTNSVTKFLRSMKFKNINKINFLETINFKKTELNFMILKSGDFRDDSGLYFTAGGTSFILNVDSNNLNSHNLPETDVFGASYAGGASGFPLVFENYSEKEKKNILSKNKKIFKSIRLKELQITNAKYFLPYAGNFKERLSRNEYIKKNNQKNTINDYIETKNNFMTLNTHEYNEFKFFEGSLQNQEKIRNIDFLDLEESKYEINFKNSYSKLTKKEIENYFLKSNFKDNLILFINLLDLDKSNYSISIDFSLSKIKIEFFKKKFSKEELNKKFKEQTSNYLMISTQTISFINIIKNMDSWENLVIGFECMVYRIPNIYNVKFWHHFSNIYVKNKFVKKRVECYSCERLNQNLFNEISNI
tara:strand:- start:1177 stop:2856 length:1680 start_codon:yes stop_codon:yes gene_type:complete